MSVILYEHINFRGRHKHIVGRDEPNLHTDGWGDRVSSIQIISGQWDFFEHVDYGGSRVTLSPGSYPWVENVNIRNDSLSSVRRRTPIGPVRTPGLIAYEHIDYRGDHKHIFGRDEPNLHVDGWGDRISSFQIVSGRWQFCQHIDYGGFNTVRRPGNYRWVQDVGIPNDFLSSIRRFNPAVVVPPMPTVETILYEHRNFAGEHKHLINHGERNLHADGWGDRVSSFQVIAGTRWTFHEHINYGGGSRNLGPGSYPWVVDVGIPNDIISSVRANIVPIFAKTIQGAAPNIARDFNVANQIFNRYGIEFLNLGQATNNVPALLDLDQPTCFRGQTPTAEENQLFNLERDHAPSDIVNYYVRSTNMGVRGCAAHPANRPGAVICDSETQYTMAHEIGHVLGLSHVNDTSNLMNNGTAAITTHPPNLTPAQLNTIRLSTLLV